MAKNIYLISNSLYEETLYKIGITKRAVSERLKDFKTGNPNDFNIVHVYVAENYAHTIESTLHRRYKTKRVSGEWFELNQSEVDSFLNDCELLYQNFLMLSESSTLDNFSFK